ncbi:hypothetical protein [Streptacidiphilus jiangxiensis]|uniref:Uncharacterized protein n=1 Tax=Streptacidiphilus jiangxiensis TaxID=235985 RepID=A0A1H8ALN1_STRJI|nr:hypothetical protein [Streptacidiphilus jiangxiensis]SEM71682.1 hypothetical protein SAMN05414137_14713 [Streptacidiphilus jiangxiensis]
MRGSWSVQALPDRSAYVVLSDGRMSGLTDSVGPFVSRMVRAGVRVDTTALGVPVLGELDLLRRSATPCGEGLAQALFRFDSCCGPDGLPASWWSSFDARARLTPGQLRAASEPLAKVPAWHRLPAFRSSRPASGGRSRFWVWALAACAADGRTRAAALAAERLPLGHPGLLPLLVVRCADWVPAVRTAARAALSAVLAEADPAELARAAAGAWSCAGRERGAAAVRIVTSHLTDAPAGVWRALLFDPDVRIRRFALAEAVALGRDDAALLLDLAMSHRDVVAAQRSAEHLVRRLVPAGVDAPASPEGRRPWTAC